MWLLLRRRGFSSGGKSEGAVPLLKAGRARAGLLLTASARWAGPSDGGAGLALKAGDGTDGVCSVRLTSLPLRRALAPGTVGSGRRGGGGEWRGGTMSDSGEQNYGERVIHGA